MATKSVRFKKVKSHTFDGKRYHIKWRKPYKAQGWCEPPSAPAPIRAILVNPNQTLKEVAHTCIHEALHAEAFYLDEDTVTRIAENLTEFLCKCGFLNER